MALRWLRPRAGGVWVRIVMFSIGLLLLTEEGIRSCRGPDPRAVAGVVLDTGGQPVAGAEVWGEPDGFLGLTGRDGSFRFTVPLKSELVLRAVPDSASQSRLEPVRVPAKAGETEVVLTVPAGGRIRFRLDPVPAAPTRVRAELRSAAGESLRYGSFDSSGVLTLASLPPGPLTLEVTDKATGATALLPDLHPASQEVPVRLSTPGPSRVPPGEPGEAGRDSPVPGGRPRAASPGR